MGEISQRHWILILDTCTIFSRFYYYRNFISTESLQTRRTAKPLITPNDNGPTHSLRKLPSIFVHLDTSTPLTVIHQTDQLGRLMTAQSRLKIHRLRFSGAHIDREGQHCCGSLNHARMRKSHRSRGPRSRLPVRFAKLGKND